MSRKSLYGQDAATNAVDSSYVDLQASPSVTMTDPNTTIDQSVKSFTSQSSSSILSNSGSRSALCQDQQRVGRSTVSSKEKHHHRQVVESSIVYDKQDFYSLHHVLDTIEDTNIQGKINQYIIIRDIGSGAYGSVTLCKNLQDNFYYACKVISKSKLQKKFRWKSNTIKGPRLFPFEGDTDPMQAIRKEIAILKKLSKHPNINALVEVIDDEKEDNLYMFFELCERGPVMTIKVNEPRRPYSEELARRYFRDLLLGIEYLHKNRIIHRDIKPANLLLTNHRVLQVADFGISHMFEEGEDDKLFDKNTSPLFCPPEACQNSSIAIRGFPFDVWSMGVTLYCFVHGYCPFEDECIPDLYTKICYDEPIISTDLSSELRDLILGMLAKKPNMRPTIKQIRNDAWVLNYGTEPLITEEENCITEDVTEEDIRDAVVKRFMDQYFQIPCSASMLLWEGR
ncbi:kinase-like domain-containing protein [Chytriomyces sp. MP71]|nr:kinase-like domain-containing protein [Chytriomyces sp. MP71]